MKRKPYPKYKPSGVEWLGEIPEGWEVFSLRRFLRVSSGDMISIDDFQEEGYPIFGGNGFRGYTDRWNTENNTIIIGRYGALCGNVRLTEERIWATEHAFRVIPLTAFDAKFLASVIKVLDLNKLSERTAQPGLNSEMVRNHMVCIPPLAEQRAIATYLDRETGRIDGLIEKKERQIALLQEKRSALISALVTGQLSLVRNRKTGRLRTVRDEEMRSMAGDLRSEILVDCSEKKNSDVEWLGQIPEHWEVKRLKYSADLINYKLDGKESDLPYTGLEHIEPWTGKHIAENEDSSSEGLASHFKQGDVLFGKLRPYLAKVYAAATEGLCSSELLVLRPKEVIQNFLFNYMLNSDFITVVDSSTYGAKMPRASWDFIGNLSVLIPPLAEQHVIASYLDAETSRLDGLVAKIEKSIELLREYRTALISAAVTGRIRVCGEESMEVA